MLSLIFKLRGVFQKFFSTKSGSDLKKGSYKGSVSVHPESPKGDASSILKGRKYNVGGDSRREQSSDSGSGYSRRSRSSRPSQNEGFSGERRSSDFRRTVDEKERKVGGRRPSLNVVKSAPSEEEKFPVVSEKAEVSSDKVLEGSFDEFSLESTLLKSLQRLQIFSPTKVQNVAIPKILSGKNLICISQTGSGKTLAFLLPLLQRMLRKEVQQSLILSPTRELAIQIAGVLNKFGTSLGFSHALVIGGMDMREQKNALRKYPEILVATPGRLLDMVRSGLVWLKYSDFVVLDEADRMLDMGFEKDLVYILQELPPVRQTLFFTATMLPGVEKIANTYVKNFEKVQIDHPTSVADSISHYMIPVSGERGVKFELLKEVLQLHNRKIIVFFNTIRETKSNHEYFRKIDRNLVTCIHSEKSQDAREKSIQDFRSGKRRILFATDVAARGIDVPDVELVINYDVPNNPEDYIHRIGRTGRGGNTGIAKTFCTSKDRRSLFAIERILSRTIERDSYDYQNASEVDFSRDAPSSFRRKNKKRGFQKRF